MAWYRAGGAGIPASLKSGMNSVLNKKFGTTGQNYPPAGWPDNVNLLGPLPEKTVSGAIASFSDGADDVPLKSLVCNVDANLYGVSSVAVVHGVKNFVDDNLTNLEQGTIEADHGTNSASNTRVRNANYTPFPYDDIYPSYHLTIPTGWKIAIRFYKSDNTYVTLPSWAVGFVTNLPSDLVGQGVTKARFVFAKTDNSAITPEDVKNIGYQLEVGTTATTYAPYVQPTTHTANLGRTIYGGSVDVVNGTCSKAITETKTFDGSSDENWQYSSSYGWFYIDNQFGDAYRNNTEDDFMACNLGTQTKYSSVTALPDMHFACTSGTNSRFAFKNSQYSTVEAFKEWLSNNNMVVAYTSATFTPFTFDGQEINSFYGNNSIWADTGDISDCTYRADIAMALAQNT